MKKYFLYALILALSAFWTVEAYTACTNTPNLGLCKPGRGDLDWDTNLNLNFDKIDNVAGGTTEITPRIQSSTKAGLGAAGTAGRLARVTDDLAGFWDDNGIFWKKNFPFVNAQDAPFLVDPTRTAAQNATGLQAAINALPATGGFIILPPGKSDFSSPLTIDKSHVKIIGLGRHDSEAAGTTQLNYTGTGTAITLGGTTAARVGIVLADFGLTGTATATVGIDFSATVAGQAARAVLNRISVSGFSAVGSGIGVRHSFGIENVIQNSYIYGNDTNIQVLDGTTLALNGIVSRTAKLYGLHVKRIDGLSVFGQSVFESNFQAGIYLEAAANNVSNVVLDGVYFENNNRDNLGKNYQLYTDGAGANRIFLLHARNLFFVTNVGAGDVFLDFVNNAIIDGMVPSAPSGKDILKIGTTNTDVQYRRILRTQAGAIDHDARATVGVSESGAAREVRSAVASNQASYGFERRRVSAGSPADVVAGDDMGLIFWDARAGGSMSRSIRIVGQVDGAPGAQAPSRVLIETNTGAGLVQAVKWDAGQNTIVASKNFGNLGTPENGAIVYCSDCTVASPCAGAGAGALAKRIAGAWVCN